MTSAKPRGRSAAGTSVPSVEEEVPHYAAARTLSAAARLPAVHDRIRVGTAGWTDPTLIKSHRFYPSGATQAEPRLRHYAEHFRLVEVDATYYTILEPALVARWVAWTPPDFCFNVKAHASLTGHPVDVQRLSSALQQQLPPTLLERGRLRAEEVPAPFLDALWQGFAASVQPLRDAQRLGSLLFQFPPWFTATRGSVKHLEALGEHWRGYPIAAEFRHPSWLAPERCERVFDLLTRLNWSYVAVDEPVAATGGVPNVVRVTQPDLAVVRLHGQNVSGWRRGASVAERFNYLYTEAELRSWLKPIQHLAQQARQVHVVFNNCVRDYAIVNAKGLSALLQSEPGAGALQLH